MITKANVPSSHIVVGVTSYGRSFGMTTPGCITEECTYTGPTSGAYAGQCTGTSGYISNAEIAAIIAGNATVYASDGSPVTIDPNSINSYYDGSSQSNILVYNGNQWVSYLNEGVKAYRRAIYQNYGFLGTADRAVDLQSFNGDLGNDAASSIVSIDPSLWQEGNPTATCEPPCILLLPPYPLGYTTTISWPVLTTTLLSSASNVIVTVTTTISVPAFTITDVSLEPVTLESTDSGTYTINPVQSITPSSFVFTLPPNEATFPVTLLPTPGQSVGGPNNGGQNPTGTSSTTGGAVIFPGVNFHSTPTPITIQPMPTWSISIPKPPPRVTISTGPPGPTCRGSGCGTRNCGIFGCGGGGCGLFGCGGGCGLFGCGGGCGVFGCGGNKCPDCGYTCPLDTCGGLNCVVPDSCGGSEGGDDNDNDECSSSITVSTCTYYVGSYSTSPMTTYSTTTSTSCATSTVCDGGNSATTVTPAACSASIAYVDSLYEDFLILTTNGYIFPEQFADMNTGSGDPQTPYFGVSLSSSTSSCTGCTWSDGVQFNCQEVDGCTKVTQSTSTASSPGSPTVISATPTASVTAKCYFWNVDSLFFEFEVNDIAGWLQTDYGEDLLDNERGCGAVTGWTFNYGTNGAPAVAYFNLPTLIGTGCVEDAILAAGGPALSCQGEGTLIGKKRRQNSNPQPQQSPSYRAAPTTTWTYTYSSGYSTAPAYTPAKYNSNSAVTVTWTPLAYSSTVYTTTTVIQNGTQVSFSGSPSMVSYSNATIPVRMTSSKSTSTTSSGRSSTVSSTSTLK